MTGEKLTTSEWLDMHGEDPDPQNHPWLSDPADPEYKESRIILEMLGVDVGEENGYLALAETKNH